MLCARTQQLLDRQGELVPLTCPEEVEWHAQYIAAQLLSSFVRRLIEIKFPISPRAKFIVPVTVELISM